MIRDGVAFAVIAGTERAWPVFPPDGGLADRRRADQGAAKQAVAGLRPGGGTAIGQWLRPGAPDVPVPPGGAAARHPAHRRQEAARDPPQQLAAAISLCEGVFSCDCRGVGTDWEVGELRRISTALLGTVDIVPDPAGLAADFAAMMQAAMGKAGRRRGAAGLDTAARHGPVHEAGRARRRGPDRPAHPGPAPQAGDYPTGAWGDRESRDYHLCVRVSPDGVGQEMLAARVSLVLDTASGPQILGQGLVRAIWTDDEALSTRINRHVAHYTGPGRTGPGDPGGAGGPQAG